MVKVIHGDGGRRCMAKGGDNLDSGHNKGVVVAFCDRHRTSPFIAAPGNRNESPLLKGRLPRVTRIAKQVGLDLNKTIVSLDGVYDSRANRKAIFNRGMVPFQKICAAERPPSVDVIFAPAIFQERFHTIERVFAWEDKFRRLLLRFE